MTSHSILRIERANYVIGGIVVILAALFVTQRQALGVALGVALTCLNFAALRWLVFKWTAAVKAGDEKGGSRIYLILPKMVGMMAAVALVVIFLPIDAIAFLFGYSIFLPAIAIGAVIDTVRPVPDPDSGPVASPPPTSPASDTHG